MKAIPDDHRHEGFGCLMGDYRWACNYIGRAAYTILIYTEPKSDADAIELIKFVLSWPGASLCQRREFLRLRKRIVAWTDNLIFGLGYDYGWPKKRSKLAKPRRRAAATKVRLTHRRVPARGLVPVTAANHASA